MKSRDTLIRLKRFQVEEKRRRVRQIETEALNKMAESMEDPRERMMADFDE